MNKTKSLLAIVLLAGAAHVAPAFARPPTVMNSPGYDARLAESRKAWADWAAQQNAASTVVAPRGLRKPRRNATTSSSPQH